MAGEIGRALRSIGADVVDLGGAGRTDAGVHALRQTAHLRLKRPAETSTLRRAINDALPHDIHVLSVIAAHAGFHARHDAVSRVYLYQIARRRTAFAKRHVWWVKRPLDLEAMRRAAAGCEGRHDFRNFCDRPEEQESTIVVVQSAGITESGDLLLVRIVASHFLWKMVRRIVGAIVAIGSGEGPPGGISDLIAGAGAGARVAEWTAPASGLFLERVVYPGEAPPGPPEPVIPVAGPTAGGLHGASIFLGSPGPHRG